MTAVAGQTHLCRLCGTLVMDRTAFCPQCGTSVTPPTGTDDLLLLQLHALFDGELRIEHELGRGAMAAVFAAYDPALDRRVAVKTLLPELADNSDFVERFQREARTVAALQHQNIVAVHRVRSNETTAAIVMQFIDGRALDAVLEAHAPLPTGVAGFVLAQVAAGLSHAHERGVVHRDIKPANVLLAYNGLAVVSDFGIARRDGVARVTVSGVVMGTVSYMSPEQLLGAPTGPTSDQYSFGVMAYELLSGQHPFRGTTAQIMFAHLNTIPPSLAELRPELPADVCDYVTRLLEKDPARRHPSLREARRVFLGLVPDEVAATTQIVSISQLRERPIVGAAPPPTQPPSTPRRRWPRMAAWGSGAVIATAAVVWAVAHRPTAGGLAPSESSLRQQGSASVPPAVGAGTPSGTNGSRSSTGQSRDPGRLPTPMTLGVTSTISQGQVSRSVASSETTQATITPPREDTKSATADTGADQRLTAAPPPPAPVAPAVAAATLADARAAAREFVTLCNQRRWRELDALGVAGGDAALRTSLITLVRSAPDFAAGFDRVASAPVVTADGFATEFIVELTWRGGRRLAAIRIQTLSTGGAWKLVSFTASPAE